MQWIHRRQDHGIMRDEVPYKTHKRKAVMYKTNMQKKLNSPWTVNYKMYFKKEDFIYSYKRPYEIWF